MRKLAYILLFAFLLSCGKEQSPSENTIKRTAFTMGTTLEITIISEDSEKAEKAIDDAIAEVERLNQKYSTYIKDNFMAEFNAMKDTVKLDDETWFLIERCNEINKLTEGRFDAAVGNLIDLVGFEKGSPHLPEQSLIDSVLATVGWKHIELLDGQRLVLHNGVKVNFGGIAKGYAVDRAYEVIEEAGFDKFLVSFGGEIKGIGKEWKIGIQHPRIKNKLLGEIVIDGTSVATSGDYEQFFKKDEKRYSHIIDPATGIPSDETQSVSIVAPSNTDADGIATGVFILGPKKGLEIIEKLINIECLIVDKNGNIHQSSGMDKYLRRIE